MIAQNWLNNTHNGSGGTGDLTLAARQGYPGLGAMMGSSIRVVHAFILEWTSDPDANNDAVLSKAESIVCPLDNTGGSPILKRSDGNSVVLASFDGSNLYPQQGSSTAPSKQTFGATAANVRVVIAQGAEDGAFFTPKITATASVGAGLGQTPVAVVSTSNANINNNIGTGVVAYVPFYWAGFGLYTQICVALMTPFTGATTSTLNLGIYEVGMNGDPGKKLADFTAFSGLTGSARDLTSSALGTPVFLTPGWYYLAILPIFTGQSGSLALAAMTPLLGGPLGFTSPNAFSGNGAYGLYSLSAGSQTVLSDPASAPTSQKGLFATIVPAFGLK